MLFCSLLHYIFSRRKLILNLWLIYTLDRYRHSVYTLLGVLIHLLFQSETQKCTLRCSFVLPRWYRHHCGLVSHYYKTNRFWLSDYYFQFYKFVVPLDSLWVLLRLAVSVVADQSISTRQLSIPESSWLLWDSLRIFLGLYTVRGDNNNNWAARCTDDFGSDNLRLFH